MHYYSLVNRNHKNQFRNLRIKPRQRFQNHIDENSELWTLRLVFTQRKMVVFVSIDDNPAFQPFPRFLTAGPSIMFCV